MTPNAARAGSASLAQPFSAMIATVSGPRKSIVTAGPIGISVTASKKLRVINAIVAPRASTPSHCRRSKRVTSGRTISAMATAAQNKR